MAVGDIGNNGTSNVDYATSIARHLSTLATGSNYGAFAYGDTATGVQSNFVTGTKSADFDQDYDPINGLTYDGAASTYTVNDGDTLQGIAYSLWGDASYWYLIADANGMVGNETLVAGQTLSISNKVHNSHNSSDIYKVYDPNEAIGNTSPTTPKPHKNQDNSCGGVGQFLMMAVSMAVAAVVGPLALGLVGVQATAAGIAAADFGPLFVAGAITGAASSIVSQGVGLALGIQKKFDWGAVAMDAIGSGIGQGLGNVTGLTGVGGNFLNGILGSAITQGIGLATGLQKRFDWTALAMAGFQGAASGAADDAASSPGQINMTLISGDDLAPMVPMDNFGDNILVAPSDGIDQTIGNAVADRVQADSGSGLDFVGHGDAGPASDDSSQLTEIQAHLRAGFDNAADQPLELSGLDQEASAGTPAGRGLVLAKIDDKAKLMAAVFSEMSSRAPFGPEPDPYASLERQQQSNSLAWSTTPDLVPENAAIRPLDDAIKTETHMSVANPLRVDPRVMALLNQISLGEGTSDANAIAHGFASGYDVPLGFGQYGSGNIPLSQMTLDEVDALQTQILNDPNNSNNSSAVGRYQFTRTTLRGLEADMGLSGADIFDADLQDRLANRLLEQIGLHSYISGQMPADTFQQRIANQWDSVQAVNSLTTVHGGRLGTTTAQIQALISQLRR